MYSNRYPAFSRRGMLGLIGAGLAGFTAVGCSSSGSSPTSGAANSADGNTSGSTGPADTSTTTSDTSDAAVDTDAANPTDAADVVDEVVPATTADPTELEATPSCIDDDEPTMEVTEGPYFSTGSPERTDFRDENDTGQTFVLSGIVTDTSCAPIGGAKIELWHADSDGEYDNEGFSHRGHFFTAQDGSFSVTTIKAGIYPGRTRHFHVKVQPEGGAVLTSQLFWPDEPDNSGDSIFDESLLMTIASSGDTETGQFHFVL